MSKEKLQERVKKITELATGFCAQELNESYFALTEKVIGKLSRKRPSPLLKGKETIWVLLSYMLWDSLTFCMINLLNRMFLLIR